MTNEQAHDTWELYASAWKEPTKDAKARVLAASVESDCVYRDPLAVCEGHGALVEYMLAFHQQVPGGHFQTTYFLAHNGRSIAKWNMVAADGSPLSDGVSYGEYNAQGKLVAMTGFFEVPPR